MNLSHRISRFAHNNTGLLIATVALACVFHSIIRIYDLGHASFWNDETLTWWMSKWSPQVLLSTVLDVHPPLYFGLMGLWKHLFGSSEFSFRLVSVIFSLLTLLSMFLHANAINEERNFWLFPVIAVLFCFSPYEIHLARFARSFTMLMFLCTAFSYTYFRFTISGEKYYWFLSLPWGIAAVYTHHLALVYVPCTIISCFLLKPGITSGLRALLLGAIIALSYLPWSIILPFQIVIKQFQYHYHSIADISGVEFLSLINPYPVGVIFSGLDYSVLNISGLILSIAALVIVVVRLRDSWRNIWTRALLVQSALIVLFMSISPTPLLSDKNLCILFPSALLILGYSTTKLWNLKSGYAGPAFLIAFVAVSAAGFPHSNRAPDWRGALKYIAQATAGSESTVLIIRPVFERPTLDYYHERGDLPERLLEMERVGYGHSKVSETVRQILKSEKNVNDVIVLSSKWAEGRPDDLAGHSDFVISETKDFMALDYYHLKRKPPDE